MSTGRRIQVTIGPNKYEWGDPPVQRRQKSWYLYCNGKDIGDNEPVSEFHVALFLLHELVHYVCSYEDAIPPTVEYYSKKGD